jgi:hypothetical protein
VNPSPGIHRRELAAHGHFSPGWWASPSLRRVRYHCRAASA